MQYVLEFLSTLIWQAMLVAGLYFFRREVAGLLAKVASIKFGDAEVSFQEPADDAEAEPVSAPEVEVRTIGPGGFLTPEGVIQLIRDSDAVPGDDSPIAPPFLLFRTSKQRTWLVRTPNHLVCVLDDESTRARGRLVQWRLPLGQVTPIRAREKRRGTGRIDLGPRKGWLYSTTLHPDPEDLEREVEALAAA